MQKVLFFLSVLILVVLIPNSGEGRGSRPPKIAPLTIYPSTNIKTLEVGQQIKFSATGGVPPYKFSANIGAININTGAYIAPSSPGQAIITVRDNTIRDSTGGSAIYRVTVSQKFYQKLDITPKNGSVGTNGNITFRATGGIPPYKYSTTSGRIDEYSGLFTAPKNPGSSDITVTDSLNNKTTTGLIVLGLTINPSNITLAPNATTTFTGSGGVPPYTFSANHGSIDSIGFYTFLEGTKSGDVVQIRDSVQNEASAVIFGDFSNLWTWMNGSQLVNQQGVYGTKGIASDNNFPGARYSTVGWADDSGNLWIFGGVAYTSSTWGRLNDLWKYNTFSNQWTWVSGSNYLNGAGIYGTKRVASPTNTPGSRENATSWKD